MRRLNIYYFTLILFLLITGFYVSLNFFGLTIGDAAPTKDFLRQHVRFIDGIRIEFWNSHQLFPQFITTLGSGQSAATLYYHGLYNPLIMLSFAFPFISTLYWMQIIQIILVTLTGYAMFSLLSKHAISRKITIVVAALTAFTPVLFFHAGFHPMFGYPFPFIILALVGVNKIVTQGKIGLFVLSFSMIFFTNYFFAPITSVILVIYYIYLVWDLGLNKTAIKSSLLNCILAYIISVLISAFVLIPQLLFMMNSSRSTQTVEDLLFFNPIHVMALFENPYYCALGFMGIFTLILGLIHFEHRKLWFLSLFLTISFFCDYLIYTYNLFIYVHQKVFICYIPLLFLLFALLTKVSLNRKKVIISFFASLVLTGILIGISLVTYWENPDMFLNTIKHFISADSLPFKSIVFIALILCQVLLVLFLFLKKGFTKVLWVLLLSICCLNVAFSTSFVTHSVFEKEIAYNIEPSETSFPDPFYRINTDYNKVFNGDQAAPLLYASMVNKHYSHFLTKTLDIEEASMDRNTNYLALDNQLMANLFGIKSTIDKKGIRNYEDVNPYIYGVKEENVYSLDSLDQLEPFERNFALNNGLFVPDSTRKYELPPIPYETLYKSDATLYYPKGEEIAIPLPENRPKEGLLVVKINTLKASSNLTFIFLGDHYNAMKTKNRYGTSINKTGVFMFDITPDMKDFNAYIRASKNTYSDFEVSAISQSYIDEMRLPLIKTIQNKIIKGKGYAFNLNMLESGYLATTIPYDEGFEIWANGKKIPTIKSDTAFLSAKLPKGDYTIKIIYTLPGFKLGSLLALGGILILILFKILGRKRKSSPLFS